MLFDAHSDVLYDIIDNNHDFVFHMDLMHSYKGSILNYYFKGTETHDEFLFVLLKIKFFYEESLINNYRKRFILGVEGLGPVRYIEDIDILHQAHVKCVSLTWNDINLIGSGTFTESSTGLSKFGYKVLDKMAAYGMILDLSHANAATFADALNYYKGKVFVSHANVYSLCPNERNLKDEAIRALIDKGGIIGLNAYRHFVGPTYDLKTLANHIVYLKNLIGIEHICLGLDDDNYLRSTHSSGMIDEFQQGVDVKKLRLSLLKVLTKEETAQVMYKNIQQWLEN